ncbi:MAG: ATP-binding cassette domain-containing protein [Alphaproteobacteria bacterium]|nr:ATP-binding cassette domain-containing protein [Alphaproteobacteria bacterium]
MRSSRSSSTGSASEAAAVPVVRVRGLATRIGGRMLLRDASFDLHPGEVLGVVGASGSGKSVLLRTIIGLVPAAAGVVEVFGEEMGRSGHADLRRFGTRWGVLFQDGALFSSLSVAENIMVPLREQLDLSPVLMREIAALKIALVGLPPDTAEKFPAALSGGMRKRAGLARALALDPKLLLLDEPTAGLDPIAASDFDRLVRDLKESLGLTVFMVTHDLDSLIAICDRIAVIVDERLVIGTLAELVGNPYPWIQAYFRGPRGRAAQIAEAANG